MKKISYGRWLILFVLVFFVLGSFVAGDLVAQDHSGESPSSMSPGGHSDSADGGHQIDLPLWTIIPFILMLLSIAIIPLLAEHWWERHRNKGLIALLLGLPVFGYILSVHPAELVVVGMDYASFIILLGALYIIAGGIHIKGSLAGTPLINTVVLAIGTLLASFIGTTGAAMVLIRPLIRANKARRNKAHIIIFFIFLVSNCGGLLTPLGDPPLFLGFLKGVPFEWTFTLWQQWVFVCVILLIVFNLYDQWKFNREDIARPVDLVNKVEPKHPIRIEGKRNFIFLGGMILTIYYSGSLHWPFGVKEILMIMLTIFSLKLTARKVRQENEFTFGPIIEVAVLFAGIFTTMIPALIILNANAESLRVTEPWQFFWITGVLSSFLDNAPTYLTMTATACGLPAIGVAVQNNSRYVGDLLTGGLAGEGVRLLTAISCGAVFMGAMTYIGNGPNFMVKAIAEKSGVKMPSFFGYMLYSCAVLLPLLALTTVLMWIVVPS